MASHMGSNFLNSCIKVPIDPCNNCPAPIYNRPKIFLSRNAPASNKLLESNQTTDIDLKWDTIYHTNGIRSLATFYESIPDYCEINHLPENEFYLTLEGLKTAYSQLKSSSNHNFCVGNESNISLENKTRKQIQNTSKKLSSRKNSANKDNRKTSISQSTFSYKDFYEKIMIFDHNPRVKKLPEESTTPKDGNLNSLNKSVSMYHLWEGDQEEKQNLVKSPQTQEEIPGREKFSTPRENRKHLKKSFSFNDIYTKCGKDGQKAEANIIFCRTPETNTEVIPNIIVSSSSPPNPGENKIESSKGSHYKNTQRLSKKSKKHRESTLVPFSFLGINECSINGKSPSVSPIHPVARPNLAAMLRLEVCKKKVEELKKNCTFNDKRPHVDWEVRKTPAWKSLSHNESHKDILALRLATRKAEQEHQQRQYELHMEIMRQRVKSAPLLLEGSTFWGPHVGKVSHSCFKNNLEHTCQHGTKGQKKKKSNRSNYKKYHSNTSYSRISNHSTNLQESDELSSLDRAYL